MEKVNKSVSRFLRRWTIGGRQLAARAGILALAFVLGLVAV